MTCPADDIEPDSKDWTWVLAKPCPDCGFDASAVQPEQVAALLRTDAADWVQRLRGDPVRVRPVPSVWSTLEYGCHIRDVHRIFDTRVHLMLAEDKPHFPNGIRTKPPAPTTTHRRIRPSSPSSISLRLPRSPKRMTV